MRKYKIAILVLAIAAAAVVASPLKTWVVGETLTYSDINANFAHIHGLMVGGHGPRLVNADVSSSAAISHAKLATPALVPKIWGMVACSGSCSATEQSPTSTAGGISSITYTSAGVYVVNFAARFDANFAVIVNSTTSASADAVCHGWPASNATAAIRCITASTGAALESNFSILIMDEE